MPARNNIQPTSDSYPSIAHITPSNLYQTCHNILAMLCKLHAGLSKEVEESKGRDTKNQRNVIDVQEHLVDINGKLSVMKEDLKINASQLGGARIHLAQEVTTMNEELASQKSLLNRCLEILTTNGDRIQEACASTQAQTVIMTELIANMQPPGGLKTEPESVRLLLEGQVQDFNISPQAASCLEDLAKKTHSVLELRGKKRKFANTAEGNDDQSCKRVRRSERLKNY